MRNVASCCTGNKRGKRGAVSGRVCWRCIAPVWFGLGLGEAEAAVTLAGAWVTRLRRCEAVAYACGVPLAVGLLWGNAAVLLGMLSISN